MVRSLGIAAVVLGLAWSGLAEAQSSSPPQAAPPRQRYITVREEGKPPQRCKLLKSWREPNGTPVFQVQAVDTGEVMTIVGSGPPAQGGNPRAMSTRIFRWGHTNKPPAGAPLPPTASAKSAPPARPVPSKAKPIVTQRPIRPAPQPSAPPQVAKTPRPTPAIPTARKPKIAPSPTTAVSPSTRPTIRPPAVTSNKPAPSAGVGQPKPFASSKSRPLTPMGTQVIPQRSARKPKVHDCSPSTPPQPRLVPSASATAAGQTPSNCDCPTPCNDCCQPYNPCGQPACVCCPPSPMRQSFISRLFKTHPRCVCTETACQPAPTPAPAAKPTAAASAVAKVPNEPAKPRDWRESWGKVEPWKDHKQDTAKAGPSKPAETVSQRKAPKPVEMEASKQPDPIKNPDMYRDMALSARPANSKIREKSQQAADSRPKSRLFSALRLGGAKPSPTPPQQPAAAVNAGATPNVPSPLRSPGRVVQLPANEGNAFWSPPEQPKPDKEPNPKYNAWDRDENNPPKPGVPPRIAPGYSGPLPPRGPMPMVRQRPLPNAPSRPDMGVPDAMANAFTLAGTRRPIPADFGGTPQEPNGFAPHVRMGQGSPPLAYGMGMSAMPRPPMPNRMAMGPRPPMMGNPLMSVPATPVAPARPMADARSAGVPQLLAKLNDSLYPSERETAAEQLSELNWRVQPQIVASLMKSAREDPAATVRAACIHALAHMQVATPAAVALVRNLKSDRDPRVRQEAEEALNALGDTGIQQTSHK